MSERVTLESDGATVKINDFAIRDKDLYNELKNLKEKEREIYIEQVLKIGTQGTRRMNTTGEVDFIQKELGSLAVSIETNFKNQLREYFAKGGTVDKMFDPSSDYTLLGGLKCEILNSIEKLRDAVIREETKEEIIDVTTLKGYKFEDACEELLENIVKTQLGDELERTTDKLGDLNVTTGDFVVSIRDSKNITLETKDWESVTLPQILDNLERAMKNRRAEYGIFVVKSKEALPKKIGIFNEYRQNMLVCALGSRESDTFEPEILAVAYQWAKMRLQKNKILEEDALETIMESIKEVENELDAFVQIKTQCTNIENSAGKIKSISDNTKDEIKEKIQKIYKAMILLDKENDDNE